VKHGAETGAGTAAERADDAETGASREPSVRCAACRARVAPTAARAVVAGAHEHTFMNPAGLRFVVWCFAAAPGTVSDGERSTVWTWFPGHAWQVALCRSCGAHLGWSFHAIGGAPTSFWGLVRDRLLVLDAGE
jgi:hypothetical protein